MMGRSAEVVLVPFESSLGVPSKRPAVRSRARDMDGYTTSLDARQTSIAAEDRPWATAMHFFFQYHKDTADEVRITGRLQHACTCDIYFRARNHIVTRLCEDPFTLVKVAAWRSNRCGAHQFRHLDLEGCWHENGLSFTEQRVDCRLRDLSL
jgi:hypothetical protein